MAAMDNTPGFLPLWQTGDSGDGTLPLVVCVIEMWGVSRQTIRYRRAVVSSQGEVAVMVVVVVVLAVMTMTIVQKTLDSYSP